MHIYSIITCAYLLRTTTCYDLLVGAARLYRKYWGLTEKVDCSFNFDFEKKKLEITAKNAICDVKLNRISYYKSLSETERLKKYNCVPWKIIVGLMREQWRLLCRASFWKFRTSGEQLMYEVFKAGTVGNLERYSFFEKIQNKYLCAYSGSGVVNILCDLTCRPIQRSNVIEFATYSRLSSIFFC